MSNEEDLATYKNCRDPPTNKNGNHDVDAKTKRFGHENVAIELQDRNFDDSQADTERYSFNPESLRCILALIAKFKEIQNTLRKTLAPVIGSSFEVLTPPIPAAVKVLMEIAQHMSYLSSAFLLGRSSR